MDELYKYISLLLPIIGVGLLFLGFRIRRQRKDKVAGFLSIVGTVVRNVDSPPSFSDEGPTYHPVVEYVVGKRRYEVTSEVGYGPKKAEGSPMKVLYDPTNPASAVVSNDYFLGAYVMLGLASVFTILGGFMAYLFLFSDK